MELDQIKQVLEENLNKNLSHGRKRNIVFWYDDAGEFAAEVDELELTGARVLKLNGRNSFQVKYILEHKDTSSNYLVYAPFGQPAARENYLLDIQKYSADFSADKIAVLMGQLNVTDHSLRASFRKYRKFFNNKERYRALKAYSLEGYTEDTLDIAVLSVLCKLPFPGLEEVLMALLAEHAAGKTAIYNHIEKFGDPAAFWRLTGKYYGYELEQDLDTLGLFFLASGLSFSLQRELPPQWVSFVSSRQNDVVVFLSRFMGGTGTVEAYRGLSYMVQKQLKLVDYLQRWELEDYLECDLFSLFDEAIIQDILENLLSGVGQYDHYAEIILGRRNKHWFQVYEKEYNAAYWACVLLGQWQTHKDTIRKHRPHDFFVQYAADYCRIDTAYRKFIYYTDRAARQEWFEGIREMIENTYINGYLNTLSIKWSDSIESLQEYWELGSLPNQWGFFQQQIQPHLRKGERVFVVISDALRFEAAGELARQLNRERRVLAELIAMQGVLPSCTSLGMACLLPHRQIEVRDDDYSVSVDGVSSEGLANRNKILTRQVEESIALRYKDLVGLKRDEFRQLVSGRELIYIYHNSIDARGDHYPTESEVFDAVEEALDQLSSLVTRLVNNVTATNIYIVADHGFIYQRKSLAKYDKTPVNTADNDYVNRRFILTGQDRQLDGTLAFSMKYLLGDATGLKCITPRGTNRFPVQGGGANYVHGGPLPQEIVIPLIHIKYERGRSAGDVQKVAVTLTSITRKITNAITYLEFFQTEKLADRMQPTRLKLYLANQEGTPISNENIIIADSPSDDPAARRFREKFVLKNMPYDKTQKYYLIMEDEEEQGREICDPIPFMVDLAFGEINK